LPHQPAVPVDFDRAWLHSITNTIDSPPGWRYKFRQNE
jgi:hypothetical protein